MAKCFVHPYIPNSVPKIKKSMMKQIGIRSIEELYSDVPRKLRLKRKLNLPKPMSELEVKKAVETLLSKNVTNEEMLVFMGAGCWPHYVPAVVEEIVRRTELLTSYTPYQPEISQGMLQALFEYQSMICEITGMGVANSSLYDWSSALGEAVRMAHRLTNRIDALIPKVIHPERARTLRTYSEPIGMRIQSIDYDPRTGQLDIEDLKTKISEKTAAVYIENPTYLGLVETQVAEIREEAHDHESILIVGVDPTSLGTLKPPGEYGADIVVGEGQPLGVPMSYGGPGLGIFACRDDMRMIRQMPGGIVGMTTTLDGDRRGFCNALQTRQQHIRREKATSNICTNEALCGIAAAVYLALLGPAGLRRLGETIMSKTQYAIRVLSEIGGIKTPLFDSPHFKEFTVNFDDTEKTVEEIHEKLLQKQVHGGKEITKEFAELGETALYCVTEVHSKDDIDFLAHVLREAVLGGGP